MEITSSGYKWLSQCFPHSDHVCVDLQSPSWNSNLNFDVVVGHDKHWAFWKSTGIGRERSSCQPWHEVRLSIEAWSLEAFRKWLRHHRNQQHDPLQSTLLDCHSNSLQDSSCRCCSNAREKLRNFLYRVLREKCCVTLYLERTPDPLYLAIDG